MLDELFVVVLLTVMKAADGFAYWKMWNWYVATAGFVQITYWQGVGLSLFASIITMKAFEKTKSTGSLIQMTASYMFKVTVITGAGAIIKLITGGKL